MSEKQEIWQWVRGDDAGTVEEVKETTQEFKVFVSGRKCSIELLYEYMIPLEQSNKGFEFGNFNQIIGLDTPLSNNGINQSQSTQQNNIKIQIPEETAVKKLIKKNKKKSTVYLNTKIIIEIPSKGIFEVLTSSFGKEVFDEILNDSISQINIESIVLQLKESIKLKLIDVYKLKFE